MTIKNITASFVPKALNVETYRDLIISPHPDDEVLGCGGILSEDAFVYYCGIDESHIAPDPRHRIPTVAKEKEIIAAATLLGFTWSCNYKTKVLHYTEAELIGELEKIIELCKPERVFVPFPSYNQDHRTVYQAARVALRPHDKNHFVKKVLLYEQPQSLIWNDLMFNANCFMVIDIDRKIASYECYKSQVRDMRSPDMIRAMAKMRGAQINAPYAEAFQIDRWVL